MLLFFLFCIVFLSLETKIFWRQVRPVSHQCSNLIFPVALHCVKVAHAWTLLTPEWHTKNLGAEDFMSSARMPSVNSESALHRDEHLGKLATSLQRGGDSLLPDYITIPDTFLSWTCDVIRQPALFPSAWEIRGNLNHSKNLVGCSQSLLQTCDPKWHTFIRKAESYASKFMSQFSFCLKPSMVSTHWVHGL